MLELSFKRTSGREGDTQNSQAEEQVIMAVSTKEFPRVGVDRSLH